MLGLLDRCTFVPERMTCHMKSRSTHEIVNSRPPETISKSLALAAQERSMDPTAKAPPSNELEQFIATIFPLRIL